MAKGPEYRVEFRRRREGKTNYYLRRKLLASKLIRFVVRKSSKHLTVQLIAPKLGGDKAIVTVNTKELQTKYGWKAGTGNLPAAYLAGYLAGKRAIAKGVKNAIVDIGLCPCIGGSRIFSALKGALTAGLRIPVSEEILPDDERVKGVHIKNYYEHLAKNHPESNKQQFSKLASAGLDLSKLPEHFEEVLKTIDKQLDKAKPGKQSSKKTAESSKGG
ncbi:MAG: 50S ribosomal protein L18 [Candidatus Odinarchaeota archaeon]